jgi:hypothetical protein
MFGAMVQDAAMFWIEQITATTACQMLIAMRTTFASVICTGATRTQRLLTTAQTILVHATHDVQLGSATAQMLMSVWPVEMGQSGTAGSMTRRPLAIAQTSSASVLTGMKGSFVTSMLAHVVRAVLSATLPTTVLSVCQGGTLRAKSASAPMDGVVKTVPPTLVNALLTTV